MIDLFEDMDRWTVVGMVATVTLGMLAAFYGNTLTMIFVFALALVWAHCDTIRTL